MNQRSAYINHQLNTSVYRNSCRFSKAQRFAFNPNTQDHQHVDPLILSIIYHNQYQEQPILVMEIDQDLNHPLVCLVQTDTILASFQEINDQQLLASIGKKQFLVQCLMKLRRRPKFHLLIPIKSLLKKGCVIH